MNVGRTTPSDFDPCFHTGSEAGAAAEVIDSDIEALNNVGQFGSPRAWLCSERLAFDRVHHLNIVADPSTQTRNNGFHFGPRRHKWQRMVTCRYSLRRSISPPQSRIFPIEGAMFNRALLVNRGTQTNFARLRLCI